MKYFRAMHYSRKHILVMFFGLAALACAGPHKPVARVQPGLGRESLVEVRRKLDSIGVEDQRYREQLEVVSARHGGASSQMKALLDTMKYVDSLNILYVRKVIDAYGWLGPAEIGDNANGTIFMVVQHSTVADRKKYLPVMRDAVKAGKAKGASLALLEDRVALHDGRAQRYGSQLSWNMVTNEYYVLPLEDPDHVDERRAALGLPPMATYILNCCNLVWDVEAYKKDIRSLKRKD